MGTVRSLIELTRPANAVVAGVLTGIGAIVAGGFEAPVSMTFAVVATVLATGGGNAINDYFDREIDAINRPDRPIPRGDVSPRFALWFSVALFAVAVGLTLLLPWLAITIALINLVALLAYTEVFKGLPGVGNVVVAYLGGSTFLFGGAAVGGDLSTVVVLFALAAAATVAREIVKDVEDLAGDREEGLRTLPIAIGERRATWIAVAFVAAAVLASPLPYYPLGTLGLPYLALVIPADGLFLAGAVRSFDSPSTGQSWIKYAMFLAVIAFAVGRLAIIL